jgi:hypothetical protein
LAADPVAVSSRIITQFRTGSDQTRFGRLEFLGGLQFSSSNSRMESLSGIRFRPDGRSFVAVLDTGEWMTGAIERDAAGKLSGLSDVALSPMLNVRGKHTGKADLDAEAVALRNGEILVSYERRHRVDVYPDPGFETSGPLRTLDFLIPRRELRINGGMETVVVAPRDGPLKGSPLVVAEQSVDRNGNLYAAVLEGPRKGLFAVVRHDPFDVTDGAFLPNGDLLLLERRFSFSGGLGMRIRRIAGDDIRPDSILDGEVLLEADLSYAIDNMEGIDVIAGPDGSPHLIVVSDDNGSFFQRNLMLEFRLLP